MGQIRFREFKSRFPPGLLITKNKEKNIVKIGLGTALKDLCSTSYLRGNLLEEAANAVGEPVNSNLENTARNMANGSGNADIAMAFYYLLHVKYGSTTWPTRVDALAYEAVKAFERETGQDFLWNKGNTFEENFGPVVWAEDGPTEDGTEKITTTANDPTDGSTATAAENLSKEIVGRLRIEQGSGPYDRRFWARNLDVVGRVKDQETLEQFLWSDDTGFQWLQIAGVAGQGKSRLALELCHLARDENLHAGFLSKRALEDLAPKWADWQPVKRSLIVIDDVIGNEELVGRFVECLAGRSTPFSNPIRLLILERQPWDCAIASRSEATSEGRAQFSSKSGYSYWFSQVSGCYEEQSELLEKKHFGDAPILLKNLSADELVQITKRWMGHIGENAISPEPPDTAIKETLAKLDADGRPLYAYFLAEVIAEGKQTMGWTREDLLEETLQRDRRRRWSPKFSETPPMIDEASPVLDLAILATMVKTLDLDALLDLPAWSKTTASDIDHARVILDQPANDSIFAFDQPLLALEPDLLGAWFVLTALHRGNRSETERGRAELLAQTAWQLEPNEFASFIQRAVQDFPTHSSLLNILAVPPSRQDEFEAFSKIARYLIEVLRRHRDAPLEIIIRSLEVSANAGIAKCMDDLGLCYLEGAGVTHDVTKAFAWFRRAAEAGDNNGMCQLGTCYQNGTGVEKDEEKAFAWFQRAALAGHPIAKFYVARCFLNGTGVEKDEERALDSFRRMADSGHFFAKHDLAICYQKGTGVEKDEEKAFAWFRQAAEDGNPLAMFDCGTCYLNGTGVEKDEKKAFYWFQQAANTGHPNGMFILGACYFDGTGIEIDEKQGFAWIERAAQTGYSVAMCFVGHCYLNGWGTEKDECQAFYWVQRAAKSGDSACMNELGAFYFNGTGVHADNEQAFYWFQQAANAGDFNGMNNLGGCYLEGLGVEKDEAAAALWHERAKEAGFKVDTQ